MKPYSLVFCEGEKIDIAQLNGFVSINVLSLPTNTPLDKNVKVLMLSSPDIVETKLHNMQKTAFLNQLPLASGRMAPF